MTRARVMAQPGYNNYNQTYNTINLDAVAAMQLWTASDFGLNETVSGESIKSYQNARVHTLSLNAMKTIVNTQTRMNMTDDKPIAIMPKNTWLDTSTDQGSNRYSGFQLFAQMPGVSATNYLPEIQLVFEIDCEFKQPAYQNRPSTFESDIVGSTLDTIPDGSAPETLRQYKVVSYTIDGTDGDYRLERSDGVAGSLNYTKKEMFEVYLFNNSGKYFDGRPANYTGAIPRKPLDYQPDENTIGQHGN
jgi:hypothetical protein